MEEIAITGESYSLPACSCHLPISDAMHWRFSINISFPATKLRKERACGAFNRFGIFYASHWLFKNLVGRELCRLVGVGAERDRYPEVCTMRRLCCEPIEVVFREQQQQKKSPRVVAYARGVPGSGLSRQRAPRWYHGNRTQGSRGIAT